MPAAMNVFLPTLMPPAITSDMFHFKTYFILMWSSFSEKLPSVTNRVVAVARMSSPEGRARERNIRGQNLSRVTANLSIGNPTIATGGLTIVTGGMTKVTGNRRIVTGSLTMVTGSLTIVTGSLTMLTGNLTKVTESLTILTGNQVIVIESLTMVTGNRTMQIGSHTAKTGKLRSTRTENQEAKGWRRERKLYVTNIWMPKEANGSSKSQIR